MEPSELSFVVEQGFALVILLLLPVLVAAALGSLIAGALGSLLGLQDQGISTISRTLSVLLALAFLTQTLGSETVGYGKALWSELANVGVGAS
jgi:flagellar biosynthesis protein FliQ